jgi:hypothetical protein
MMGLASSGEDDGTALGFFNKLRTCTAVMDVRDERTDEQAGYFCLSGNQAAVTV